MIFYPEPEEVFTSDIEMHREYILPLISIDLSEINSNWKGKIHLINPIEPYDGVIGEFTNNAHTYYCRKNWIAFDILNDKYQLKTDFNFFQKNAISNTDTEHFVYNGKSIDTEALLCELNSHYKKINSTYFNHKSAYRENKISVEKLLEYSNIGGKPKDANWVHCTNFPLEIIEGEKQFHYPLTEDGRRFEFIGYFDALYLGGPCCGICLFYDPIEHIALFTFDW